MSSSEIKLALNKLDVLGSVLYIAAHPDDENTACNFLSSQRKVDENRLSCDDPW